MPSVAHVYTLTNSKKNNNMASRKKISPILAEIERQKALLPIGEKRLEKLFYKHRETKKRNKYCFCLVVDKDNKTLVDRVPEIPEFFERVDDMSQYNSDFLLNEVMYKAGYHKMLKRYFKVVYPELLFKNFKNTSKESARFPGERIYLYQNLATAMFNVEEFFNGVVWVFGDVEMLYDMISAVDKILICKVNESFKDIYPEAIVNDFEFDEDFIKRKGFPSGTIEKSKTSANYVDRMKNYSKATEKVEILSDHIKMVKSKSQVKRELLKGIPNIYNYHFISYVYNRVEHLSYHGISIQKEE